MIETSNTTRCSTNGYIPHWALEAACCAGPAACFCSAVLGSGGSSPGAVAAVMSCSGNCTTAAAWLQQCAGFQTTCWQASEGHSATTNAVPTTLLFDVHCLNKHCGNNKRCETQPQKQGWRQTCAVPSREQSQRLHETRKHWGFLQHLTATRGQACHMPREKTAMASQPATNRRQDSLAG